MTTNGFSSRVGVKLQDMVRSFGGSPRFAHFHVTLAGAVKGGVRRGDHVVEAVVLVGISYPSMVRRSLDTLTTALLDPDFVANTLAAMAGEVDDMTGAPVTEADVRDAIWGTAVGRKGLLTSLTATTDGTNVSTSGHVFDPLVVDGEVVGGCKVYTGPGNPSDPKAPVRGAVYIEGVTISSRVVTPSPNGDLPVGRRGAVVKVKDYISDTLCLPVARYARYRLFPTDRFEVRSGVENVTHP